MQYVNINALRKSYTGNFTLGDINMGVNRGEIFTLMGPSGSGKTSLLRNISGLDSPDSGQIIVSGRDVTRLTADKRNIGLIFQDLALFPHMSAFDNIAYGLRSRRINERTVSEKVDQIASVLRIAHLLDRLPSRISGGEKQRVALARSIVLSPDLLLMDEPMSSLDPELRSEVRGEIKSISKNLGLTIIYVTHDIQEGLYLGDTVGIIFRGRIVKTDTPENIFLNPQSEETAKFFGYNIINIRDETVAVHPADLEISNSDTGFKGTVETIGFEGVNYRVSIKYGNGQTLQMLAGYSEERKSIRPGQEVQLEIKRKARITEP
ncbi:MAG: ABC transporter ATP-binding protein [Thermoplasmata archaeon]